MNDNRSNNFKKKKKFRERPVSCNVFGTVDDPDSLDMCDFVNFFPSMYSNPSKNTRIKIPNSNTYQQDHAFPYNNIIHQNVTKKLIIGKKTSNDRLFKNEREVIHDICKDFLNELYELEVNRRVNLIWTNLLIFIQDKIIPRHSVISLTRIKSNDIIAAAILSLAQTASKSNLNLIFPTGRSMNLIETMRKYGGITSIENVLTTYKSFFNS